MPDLKPNMAKTKVPMPEQPPEVRSANFGEVAEGYTEEMALEEAARCLNCRHRPCVAGCPVAVNIPDFIAKIRQKDYKAAFEIIRETNSLPAVCGRVCPQERQCEEKCVRGLKAEPVGIGRLERFCADYALAAGIPAKPPAAPNGHRVAVLGSGPAGLTCAGELAKLGYGVTVFEAFHKPGGVLVYGIPEFRLPKAIVHAEITALEASGVKIVPNVIAGRSVTISELLEDGFEAVFIGTGAGLPSFMHIEGENLNGVYSANEFLTRINLMKAYDEQYDTPVASLARVAVVGGGNVAMDAARCAKRLGADVTVVYRRGEEEMPARAEEIHHAKEEGVRFLTLTSPVRILGTPKGLVRGMECVKMTLGEPDASGRRRPVELGGSNFELDIDGVIMSIGTSPNPILKSTTEGLATNSRGCIVADEDGRTSIPGVFAGGDAVTGAATVILAMGAGRQAAKAMDEYIKEKQK